MKSQFQPFVHVCIRWIFKLSYISPYNIENEVNVFSVVLFLLLSSIRHNTHTCSGVARNFEVGGGGGGTMKFL